MSAIIGTFHKLLPHMNKLKLKIYVLFTGIVFYKTLNTITEWILEMAATKH